MATIDLRTGEGHAPRREDYITKAAGVSHTGGSCELWLKFLDRVTAGEGELQRYLQRVAGYCLTGDTKEHVFFFLYGTGANGKSIFCNTLQGIWGDYACSAGIETFTESRNDRHPTELARLQGVRLAIAAETSGGSRWNEARIKTITGGDVISARYMRGDFFDFRPKLKLMVMGNRRPSLRQVDEAMRRRMHLIPFTVTIPPHERDQELGEKLRKEWPGVLQWAIDGCLAWREQGLAPPEVVVAATDAYLESENSIANWLEECCEVDLVAWEPSKALYASWREWAEENGERPGTAKAFAQALEANGATPERKTSARGFRGFRLGQPQ